MAIRARRALETSEANQLIDAFRSWIVDGLTSAGVTLPERGWLFGSAARGELTDTSDVDIALVCDDEEHVRAVRRVLGRSRRPFDWPADLVYYTVGEFDHLSEHGGLAHIVAQEGVIIVDRDRETDREVR